MKKLTIFIVAVLMSLSSLAQIQPNQLPSASILEDDDIFLMQQTDGDVRKLDYSLLSNSLLNPYYDSTEVNNVISDSLLTYYDSTEVQNYVNDTLATYYDSTEVNNIISDSLNAQTLQEVTDRDSVTDNSIEVANLKATGNVNISSESNALQFAGTNYMRVHKTNNILALGNTSADLTGTHSGSVIIGTEAAEEAKNAGRSVHIGFQAGENTGSISDGKNVCVGYEAGKNADEYLSAYGYYAGHNAGEEFTSIGAQSGQGAGNRFTALGYYSINASALTTPDNINDAVAIGYESAPQYNGHFVLQQANIDTVPLIQGDFNTGNVAIGKANGATINDKFEVNGNTIIEDTAEVKGYLDAKNYKQYIAKIQRQDSINTTNTNENYVKFDKIVEEYTNGDWQLTTDSTGITAPDSSIYNFSGLIHMVNNGGTNVTADIMVYQIAGTDTSRCGQMLTTINKDSGNYKQKSFSGSAKIGQNTPFKIIYQVGDTNIDFDSGDLPKQIAISVNFTKVSKE